GWPHRCRRRATQRRTGRPGGPNGSGEGARGAHVPCAGRGSLARGTSDSAADGVPSCRPTLPRPPDPHTTPALHPGSPPLDRAAAGCSSYAFLHTLWSSLTTHLHGFTAYGLTYPLISCPRTGAQTGARGLGLL